MVSEQGYFFVELRSSENTTLKILEGSVLQHKTWHFVGSSYNYVSGEFTIWVNGSIDNRTIVDTPVELATQESAFMGATSNSQFKGRISCLQLYDRVLSVLEIEDAKQLCSTTGRSNRNQTVYVGEAVELKCDALSNKTVQWSKDGAVLQSKTTGYGTSLLIGSVQYSDEGMYTCEVINKAGAIDASYNVAMRVKDSSSLCSEFKGHYTSSGKWLPWSVLPPLTESRTFYEEKWFRADQGIAMTTSCISEETCGVRAPGWLNGQHPSSETEIVIRQACFKFLNNCCYHSMPVQIKKCSEFFVYKLRKVHPMIAGRYCYTESNRDFFEEDAILTSHKADWLLTGHVMASERSVDNSLQCMQHCANSANGHCRSFNYNRVTGECQLNNATGHAQKSADRLKTKIGYSHYYEADRPRNIMVFP